MPVNTGIFVLNLIIMNLAIDIGNTNFHLAVFRSNKMEFLYSGPTGNMKKYISGLKKILKKFHVLKIGYSSVAPKHDKKYTRYIKKYFKIHPLTISNKSKLPVKIKVKNPNTLGSDRICNAVFGFMKSTGNTNILVIDLGTANKYDLVLSNGDYVGGIIAPGLITSSIALNLNTGKLPLIKFNKLRRNSPLIGKNTFEAIQSGLVNYMKLATEGIVDGVKRKYPGKLNIYITGGSAGLIKSKLNFDYKYTENSVLHGLNYVINFQKA